MKYEDLPKPFNFMFYLFRPKNCWEDKKNPIFIHEGIFQENSIYRDLGPVIANTFERDVYVFNAQNRRFEKKQKTLYILKLVSDLIHFLKSNNYSKVILIGHSIGGKVCSLISQLFPEVVEKLVITDISPLEKYDAKICQKESNKIKGLTKSETFDENSVGNENFRYNYNNTSQVKFLQRFFSDYTVDKKFLGETLLIYGGKSEIFSEKECNCISQAFVNCKFECIESSNHHLEYDNTVEYFKKLKLFLKDKFIFFKI